MSKVLGRRKEITIEYIEDDEQIEEVVTVEKAGLGKWKQVSDTLRNIVNSLPTILDELGVEDKEEFLNNLSMQDMVAIIPEALGIITDEIINLIAIGADLEKKYVEEKVGIDEATELVLAIIEVNKLAKAVETGNKIKGLFNK